MAQIPKPTERASNDSSVELEVVDYRSIGDLSALKSYVRAAYSSAVCRLRRSTWYFLFSVQPEQGVQDTIGQGHYSLHLSSRPRKHGPGAPQESYNPESLGPGPGAHRTVLKTRTCAASTRSGFGQGWGYFRCDRFFPFFGSSGDQC